ncbi:hypothetical protein GQ44DRAFT_184871 [Phaeosphaeriaceae sp. PMI808]|nr:hypothetical protein GQ44DRAFT_184871 [Phaeosphaeriaceae sp. PMI808]
MIPFYRSLMALLVYPSTVRMLAPHHLFFSLQTSMAVGGHGSLVFYVLGAAVYTSFFCIFFSSNDCLYQMSTRRAATSLKSATVRENHPSVKKRLSYVNTLRIFNDTPHSDILLQYAQCDPSYIRILLYILPVAAARLHLHRKIFTL